TLKTCAACGQIGPFVPSIARGKSRGFAPEPGRNSGAGVSTVNRKSLFERPSPARSGSSRVGVRDTGAPLGQRPTRSEPRRSEVRPVKPDPLASRAASSTRNLAKPATFWLSRRKTRNEPSLNQGRASDGGGRPLPSLRSPIG